MEINQLTNIRNRVSNTCFKISLCEEFASYKNHPHHWIFVRPMDITALTKEKTIDIHKRISQQPWQRIAQLKA